MHFSHTITKINEYSGHRGAVYGLGYHAGAEKFYSVAGDGWIVAWDATGQSQDGLLIADSESKLFCCALDYHGKILIAGDILGFVYWIDLFNNKIISKFKAHKNSVFDIIALDESTVITASGDGFICVWNQENFQPVISVRLSTQGVRSLAIDKKKNRLYVGSSDHNIYILDTNSWEVVDIIKNAHENTVFSLLLHGDNILLSGGRDAHLKMRTISSDYPIKHDIPAHWYTINKIVQIPSHKLIVTASRDHNVRVWQADDLTPIATVDHSKGGHRHSVNTLLWLPTDKILVSAGDDKLIKLWSISTDLKETNNSKNG